MLTAGVLVLVLLAACSSGQKKPAHPGVTTARPAATAPGAVAPRPATRSLAGRYVALGDSFTAAPLSPRESGAAAQACQRSARDYPDLVAAALGPSTQLANVSCYGATTRDLSQAQHTSGPSSPPQLDALSSADRLVTLQVGGDDIGSSGIATTCGALSRTALNGDPCQRHYTAGGTDQLAQAIDAAAPKAAAALAAIRQRAPRAGVPGVRCPR